MAWPGLGLVVIAVGLGAHGHFTCDGAGYQTGVAGTTCLKVQVEGSGVLEAAAKQTVRATVGGNVKNRLR